MYTLYGIKNCDTVKKARNWLEANDLAYQFHDVRSDGLEMNLLERLESALGWENMLNRRSSSWRQLADVQKENLTREQALSLMLKIPTLIKRPVLDTGNKIFIGFKPEHYRSELL